MIQVRPGAPEADAPLLVETGRAELSDFFAAHQGDRARSDQGRTIVERKTLAGYRLTVRLEYGPDVPPEVFEWQVYTPDEICALAAVIGFRPLVVCREFDERRPASATVPRMQLVFERG